MNHSPFALPHILKYSVFLFYILFFSPKDSYSEIETGSFVFEGQSRNYIVFLPEYLEPNMPVVFNLHGYTDYAQWQMEYSLMNEVADTAGFIVVYPDAIEPGFHTGLYLPGWPPIQNSNDVGFISALLDTIEEKYDIDLHRVYSCGYSNGGMMTFKLACQLGYRFAAGASVAGVMLDSIADNSNLTSSFPVFMCHGTEDETIPYDGGPGMYSVEQTLNYWLQINNCSIQPDTIFISDLDTTDGSTVEKMSYTDCFNGSKIIFYKVINGGHTWPEGVFEWEWGGSTNRDINASAEIWNFLKNYQLSPMAYAKNVSVNQVYVKPESDTLDIKAQIENPNEHTLSVLALIQSKDGQISDSCYFADDSNHYDDDSGDGIWGGLWPVPSGEKNYYLNIKTKSLETDQYTLSYDKNVPDFVTTGPLVYESWSHYIIEDSIANPGDILAFKLHLKNEGQERRIENVEARLYSDDPRITIHNFYATFPNIPAGSTVKSDQGYSLQLSTDFTQDTTINLQIKLLSSGNHYWNSDMSLDIVTGIDRNNQPFPKKFMLKQNYPNPFNPKTIINYELRITSNVELSIYNLLGQKVATLVNEQQQAGYHQVEWDASGFSSGVYYYRIEAGEFQDVKKMILLR